MLENVFKTGLIILCAVGGCISLFFAAKATVELIRDYFDDIDNKRR